MRKQIVLLAVLALTVPLLFFGCSGDDGATGATGATGAPGTPGAPGAPGTTGAAAVDTFHGQAFLTAEELTVENKYRANVTITSATADASGVVTVNFTVRKASDNSAVTNIPNAYNANIGAGIFKLVPAGGGLSYNKWVPYIWRTETVSGTQDSAGNTFLEPNGYTVNQGYRENSGTGASNGTLVNHADGSYTYTFKQNLTTAKRPADNVAITYDRSSTHRVIITMGGHSGATGEGDFDFVPDGSAGNGTRNIVQTATCKKCHGPEFAGHGGDRVTVEGCVTCHSPDSADAQSGNTIEMAVMIHKIHAGNELASVAGPDGQYYDNPNTAANEAADNGKYMIWGNSTRMVSWEGVAFPAVLANCQACHTGGSSAEPVQNVDNWKNVPSRAACGSCHDLINWTSGTNHGGGPATTDTGCVTCHPASGTGIGQSVTGAHNFSARDQRNISEYNIALTVSTPANGKYFVNGETPVVSIALTDNATGNPVAPNSVIQDPTAEGCGPVFNADGTVTCTRTKDGLFTGASMYVTGPRAQRIPILTYGARAAVRSANVGPWNLSAGGSFVIVVDSGMPMISYNNASVYEGYGADELISGNITVPVVNSFFADNTNATPAEVAAMLNANTAFNERAIAYVDEALAGNANAGKLAIRSRGIAEMTTNAAGTLSVKRTTAQPNVKVTSSPAGIFAANAFGAAGGAVQVRIRSTASDTDPKANFPATGAITYTLDPVDDLAPGTYVINVEIADRGRGPSIANGGINPDEPPYIDYVTPSVAVATFNVKTADTKAFPGNVEKPIADGCTACHWSDASGTGFVLDFPRHHKIFDSKAVDQCGGCHDYDSAQNPANTYSGVGFGGGHPLSKRVHAVHDGSKLNYPTITVAHEETAAFGRNWRITYPMDIRNCESCHSSSGTSGTWKTNPNRLACMGCHDSDAATAHMKAQTVDPTPSAPFSGDEQESCKACH